MQQTRQIEMVQKKRDDAIKEHRKSELVPEETPLLNQSSKKSTRKVIRDLSEIRRLFDFYDTDKSESIEPGEFLPLLSRLLKQPRSEMDKTEVWKNWDAIDADGSGSITWEEFQSWYCETFHIEVIPDFTDFFSEDIVPESERLIREVARATGHDNVCIENIYKKFVILDIDDSGSLEKPEFKVLIEKQLTQGTGVMEVPDRVLDKLWIDADADDSGSISFPEFATWYLKFFMGEVSPMEQYYKLLGSGFRSSMITEMEAEGC
jgi:Ca2+-binding EF-hand superfamily protein